MKSKRSKEDYDDKHLMGGRTNVKQKGKKLRFRIGDRVKVLQPFGISTICFCGYVVCVESVEKSWWKQIEPEYTIKKNDGGVQYNVRESWMTLINVVNEEELVELGFTSEKEHIRNGVAEHVKAADDMVYLLGDDTNSKEIQAIEMAAKGWILLAFRSIGIDDKKVETLLDETLNWAFGLLSRKEAAEYFREYRRRKRIKEEK